MPFYLYTNVPFSISLSHLQLLTTNSTGKAHQRTLQNNSRKLFLIDPRNPFKEFTRKLCFLDQPRRIGHKQCPQMHAIIIKDKDKVGVSSNFCLVLHFYLCIIPFANIGICTEIHAKNKLKYLHVQCPSNQTVVSTMQFDVQLYHFTT